MEWYIRYSLGFKPREKDILQLKELLPEIFQKGNSKYENRFIFIPFYPYGRIGLYSIMEWISQEPLVLKYDTQRSENQYNPPFIEHLNRNNMTKSKGSSHVNTAPKKGVYHLVSGSHEDRKEKETTKWMDTYI